MSDPIEYIDRYFSGELTAEEKKEFEGRCLSDPAFAKMVAFYISLHDQSKKQWTEQKQAEFAQLEAMDFQADHSGFHWNGDPLNDTEIRKDGNGDQSKVILHPDTGTLETFDEPSNIEVYKKERHKARHITMWKSLMVATAVLGIIALSAIWYLRNNKDNPAIVVNPPKADTTTGDTVPSSEYAKKNIVPDTSSGRVVKKGQPSGDTQDKAVLATLVARNFTPDSPPKEPPGLLEEAFEAYKNGSYDNASQEYEDAIATVVSLDTRMPEDKSDAAEKQRILFYAHYYNGLSYMAKGNAVKAISALEAIKQSPDNFWQSKVQWYLALAYLKAGEVEKAKIILRQVTGSKQAGEYGQKAIKLITGLEAPAK